VITNNNGQNSGGYYNGGQTYRGSIPVITFPDGDPVYLAQGEPFDKAYTAYDFEDGDLGAQVEVLNAGFTENTPAGTYVVTYRVTDSDGNTVEKKRTVFVGYTNTNTNQTIDNFATWYRDTCGQRFNRNLYDATTGAYNGNIECSNRGLYDIDLTQVGIFSTIKSLNLGHNNLRDIDFSPLSNTRVIEEVDLSYNDFAYIDFTPLYNLKNINVLRLNNNRLNYTQAEREEIYQGFNNRSFIVYF
jgi:Leucine-rich repeat (LRR) protein